MPELSSTTVSSTMLSGWVWFSNSSSSNSSLSGSGSGVGIRSSSSVSSHSEDSSFAFFLFTAGYSSNSDSGFSSATSSISSCSEIGAESTTGSLLAVGLVLYYLEQISSSVSLIIYRRDFSLSFASLLATRLCLTFISCSVVHFLAAFFIYLS